MLRAMEQKCAQDGEKFYGHAPLDMSIQLGLRLLGRRMRLS
jgi:hypothetical protein